MFAVRANEILEYVYVYVCMLVSLSRHYVH